MWRRCLICVHYQTAWSPACERSRQSLFLLFPAPSVAHHEFWVIIVSGFGQFFRLRVFQHSSAVMSGQFPSSAEDNKQTVTLKYKVGLSRRALLQGSAFWRFLFQHVMSADACCCAKVLEIAIRDSHLTGRAGVGVVRVPLRQLPMGGQQNMWLPVQPSTSGMKVLSLSLLSLPFPMLLSVCCSCCCCCCMCPTGISANPGF